MRKSLVVVVFVSRGYFRGKNTLREFIEALVLHRRRELAHSRGAGPTSRALLNHVALSPTLLLVRESESEKAENALSPKQVLLIASDCF